MNKKEIINFNKKMICYKNIVSFSIKRLKKIYYNFNFFYENFKKRNYFIDKKNINNLFENYKKKSFILNNLNFEINKNRNISIGKKIKKKKKKILSDIQYQKEKILQYILSLPNILDKNVNEKTQIIEEKIFTKTFNNNINWKKYYSTRLASENFLKGTCILWNKGINLYWNLLHKIRDTLYRENFIEIKLPTLLKESNFFYSGQLPKFEKQLFVIQNKNSQEKIFLSPTAEVPFVSFFKNNISLLKLNSRFCSFTNCYRNENIAYGKNNHGILRLLEFSKMEMFVITNIKQQLIELQKIVKIVTNFLTKNNMNYRVILNNISDTSWHSYITYDIEVWSNKLQRFIEISSCSSTNTFQIQKLNLKNLYNEFVFLNGSFLPLERLLFLWIEYHDKTF